ncbi:MAG: VCBS repeat-containing protein [Thermoplasmata archaeon]|nr:MAG: VCBS repeat-containing protein [Thermoplasmata archaeon]
MGYSSIFIGTTESTELSHIEVGYEPVKENIIEIPSGGGSSIYLGNFSLRKGIDIYDAYFNLTGLPNAYGEYPTTLRVDIGQPNAYLYYFYGPGYGSMGKQSLFSTNTNQISYSFQSGGYIESVYILLPKKAHVKSAEMKITGQFNINPDKVQIENSKNYIGEIQPVDMDLDGDIDIVAAGNSEVVWYNNTNGDGSTWKEHKIDSSYNSAILVHVYDADDDGDMDVAAASRPTTWPMAGSITYYRNLDGKGLSWEDHYVNESNKPFFNCYNIEIADMDNDGDGDIVATCRNNTAPGGVYWFNNTDGNGTAWTKKVISSVYPNAQGLAIMDIDGDGDNDTAVTNSWSGSVHWFENINNGSSWSTSILISNIVQTGFNLEKGDIDSDGDLDLIAGCRDGVRWFDHPSNPKTTWATYLVGSFFSTFISDIAVGDFGTPLEAPDGNLDIVAVNNMNFHDVIWYKNDGSPAKNFWGAHVINNNHVDGHSIKVAEIDKKNYVDVIVCSNSFTTTDDIVWYSLNGSFPSKVNLDIGSDSTSDWSYPTGWFKTTENIGNFNDTLNSILSSEPVSYADMYGNQFVYVKLNISTDTAGIIIFQGLEIEYDYTATVRGWPGSTLTQWLNAYADISGSGNVTVPLLVMSSSGGRLKIDDIKVVYNDYPKALPIDEYELYEDTRNETLIDLSKYFTDDFTKSTDMTYTVTSHTNSSYVNVFINENKKTYLGVDVESGEANDNWFGSTDVIIRARDETNLEVYSKPFRIYILPVNDEPTLGSKDLPKISMNEGGISQGINLDAEDYFTDVDSSVLYYDFIIDPYGEYDDEDIEIITYNDTNIFSIDAKNDWFTPPGRTLLMKIYCDDDPVDILESGVFRDLEITIHNLDDDAPVWSPISPVIMEEDKPKNDAVVLLDHVKDFDNPDSLPMFSIISISDIHVHADIDHQLNLDIWADENYYGTATIMLSATDGKNNAVTSFDVIINNINDAPEVELVSPRNNAEIYSDNITLVWTGSDIDLNDMENITYTITLETTEGTEYYKQDYKGTSIEISGLTDATNYYWKVIPNDGKTDGICVSESVPFKFTVSFGKKPHSVLKYPENGTATNENKIKLIWDGYSEEDDPTLYNLYVSENELTYPYPDSALIAKGIADNYWQLEDLKSGQTYYWTVIPVSDKGEGFCDNDVWTFYYDPTSTPYKFEIEAPDEIKMEYGKLSLSEIRIKNVGNNPDTIIPSVSAGVAKFGVELEGAELEHRIESGDTLILVLTIHGDKIPEGTYELVIKVSTTRPLENPETKSITLIVFEEDEESSKEYSVVYSYLTPVIFILLIVIVIFLFFQKARQRAKKKQEDAELLTKPSKTVESMEPTDIIELTSKTVPGNGLPVEPTYPLPYSTQTPAVDYTSSGPAPPPIQDLYRDDKTHQPTPASQLPPMQIDDAKLKKEETDEKAKCVISPELEVQLPKGQSPQNSLSREAELDNKPKTLSFTKPVEYEEQEKARNDNNHI